MTELSGQMDKLNDNLAKVVQKVQCGSTKLSFINCR